MSKQTTLLAVLVAGNLFGLAPAAEISASRPPIAEGRLEREELDGFGAIRIAGGEFGVHLGDVILELNGERVKSIDAAHRLLSGDPSVEELTVLRDGRRLRLRRKPTVD